MYRNRRHKITIEREIQSQVRGELISTWIEFVQMFAAVEPLSGREAMYAKAVHPLMTHKITMFYVEGIYPNMRIKWNNKIFNIQDVRNVEERYRMIEMTVNEIIQLPQTMAYTLVASGGVGVGGTYV